MRNNFNYDDLKNKLNNAFFNNDNNGDDGNDDDDDDDFDGDDFPDYVTHVDLDPIQVDLELMDKAIKIASQNFMWMFMSPEAKLKLIEQCRQGLLKLLSE